MLYGVANLTKRTRVILKALPQDVQNRIPSYITGMYHFKPLSICAFANAYKGHLAFHKPLSVGQRVQLIPSCFKYVRFSMSFLFEIGPFLS